MRESPANNCLTTVVASESSSIVAFCLPIWVTAISPEPIIMSVLLGATSSSELANDAKTIGCLVTGLVTAGKSFNLEVLSATAVRAENTSRPAS